MAKFVAKSGNKYDGRNRLQAGIELIQMVLGAVILVLRLQGSHQRPKWCLREGFARNLGICPVIEVQLWRAYDGLKRDWDVEVSASSNQKSNEHALGDQNHARFQGMEQILRHASILAKVYAPTTIFFFDMWINEY